MKLHDYLVPTLYPVFPAASGTLQIGIDPASAFNSAAILQKRYFITCVFNLFSESEIVSSDKEVIEVLPGGKFDRDFVEKSFSHPTAGYVELSITSSIPTFRQIHEEPGYALWIRPDGGLITINPQHKTSVHIIIDQIRETQNFCLIHPQQGVDLAVGIKNSTLMINPYEGALLASGKLKNGKNVKIRIPSKSTRILNLETLFGSKGSGCVIYSGSNRMLGWDIRHEGEGPLNINSVDHLEYFRANATFRKVGTVNWIKEKAKYMLNTLGIVTT